MLNPADDNENSAFRQAFQKGVAAAKHNLYPAIGLWVFGVLLIICYFYVAPVRDWLNQLAVFKSNTGWIFAAISTAIFAGVIPVVIPRLFGTDNSSQLGLAYLSSNILFWAYKGIEVDLFYILQARLFGNDSDLSTILSKVAVDQLIYAPALGLLTVVLFYLWRDNQYAGEKFRVALGQRWYRNKVLPVLISNWFVWGPACVIIYLLPLGLQLPIQNLILCFWVLILSFFTEKNEAATAEAESG